MKDDYNLPSKHIKTPLIHTALWQYCYCDDYAHIILKTTYVKTFFNLLN